MISGVAESMSLAWTEATNHRQNEHTALTRNSTNPVFGKPGVVQSSSFQIFRGGLYSLLVGRQMTAAAVRAD